MICDDDVTSTFNGVGLFATAPDVELFFDPPLTTGPNSGVYNYPEVYFSGKTMLFLLLFSMEKAFCGG
jgi:hypothetical protein